MIKKIKTFCFLFLLLVFLIPTLFAEENPIEVTAHLEQKQAGLGDMFLVEGRVQNLTNQDWIFSTFSCSYEKHWVVDQPDIVIQPWSCKENISEKQVLAPDEVYQKSVLLYVNEKDKEGPLTFRLGFKPAPEAEPIWGNPLTIYVTVPEALPQGPQNLQTT